jgi:hypothetical protein
MTWKYLRDFAVPSNIIFNLGFLVFLKENRHTNSPIFMKEFLEFPLNISYGTPFLPFFNEVEKFMGQNHILKFISIF